MNARVWRVAPFLFGSGLCALVYQTAWQRELRLIFGASTAASAAVLAIFMAGLGLGGALLGPRADKHKRPLELYGNLELLISLSAAVTPGLVWLARTIYVALGGTVTLGLAGGSVVRLVLSALLLAVPTVLMGGTLPAAARAAETPEDVRRRALAVLYGVNTLGAVAGATLSTFFLFEVFGTQQTLWLACLLNALIALGARVASRSLPEQETSAAPAEAVKAEPAVAEPAMAEVARPPRAYVLGAAALVGFAFFLMELVWYRMLGPLLGGSTFTFGIILIVALLGIGLGGAAYSAWGQQRPATLRGFALTCLAEALFIAVPFAMGDQVAVFSMLLRSLEGVGFMGLVLAWGAIASLVILPAAFISGVQFPLLLALLGRGREDVGREVGQAYAWNTVGSIIGSLAGGFGVLPLLTAPGSWRLVAAILVALGLAAALLSLRTQRRPSGLVLPAALAAATAWLLMAVGPTPAWRHNPIGAGRASVEKPTINKLRGWAEDPRYRTLWESEGVESSVGLLFSDGVSFYVNGKSDGNTIGDASTQVMSGLTGALIHPDPRRAMVIGLGTGSTAGWMGVVPGMKVDVVEIEPAILEVARGFADVNHDVMNNPNVHTVIGDAREVLLASKEKYDLIFSEPSNPYRAGISSLFTRDFYQAARQRMAPGGIFLQWLQAYEIDAQTVKSAFATLRSEFGAVEVWQMNSSDLLLVASDAPLQHDYERMRARIAQSPYREALAGTWFTDELEGVMARFLGGDLLVRSIAEGAESLINTDDLSYMEFALARTVGRRTLSPVPGLRTAALELRADRPFVMRGEVDWERVETWRMLLSLTSRTYLATPSPSTLRSREALQRKSVYEHLKRRDSAQAVRAWKEAGWQPRGMQELGVVSQALAEQGDEAAVPFVEQLRASGPLEAEVVLGRLRLKQGRSTEAAEAFERAFAQLRRSPWGQRPYLELMLGSVVELSRKEPTLARRFYAATDKPFSSYSIESQRQQLRLVLARIIDWRGLCVEALKPFEPHPVWKRDFLTQRAECYELTRHASAPQALTDLSTFIADEPLPVWESKRGAETPAAEGPPEQEEAGNAPPVANDALSQ